MTYFACHVELTFPSQIPCPSQSAIGNRILGRPQDWPGRSSRVVRGLQCCTTRKAADLGELEEIGWNGLETLNLDQIYNMHG